MSGKEQIDADISPRCPLPVDVSVREQNGPTEAAAFIDTVDAQAEQLSDCNLRPIIENLMSPTADVPRRIRRRASLFTLRDGILYRRNYEPDGLSWLLGVQRDQSKDVIRENHDDPTRAGPSTLILTRARNVKPGSVL